MQLSDDLVIKNVDFSSCSDNRRSHQTYEENGALHDGRILVLQSVGLKTDVGEPAISFDETDKRSVVVTSVMAEQNIRFSTGEATGGNQL